MNEMRICSGCKVVRDDRYLWSLDSLIELELSDLPLGTQLCDACVKEVKPGIQEKARAPE